MFCSYLKPKLFNKNAYISEKFKEGGTACSDWHASSTHDFSSVHKKNFATKYK